jgi:MATE family multidrug resistance protein
MNQPPGALSITHRKVWMLAGPIILSNISVPLVGAVDTAVVGHLPEPHSIGAVALGALIFSFLYWGFGFLRMGTTGFVAQAYGAGDWRRLSDTLLRVLFLALALGLATIIIGWPLIDFVLYLIDSSATVEGLASDYAQVRIWSAPAVLCVYAFTGIFIGMHNTRAAFVLQLILNITNVLLDVLFVLGFDWGVEGVALASVIAEYLAMFCGFYLLRIPIRNAFAHFNRARLLEPAALGSLLRARVKLFSRRMQSCCTCKASWHTGWTVSPMRSRLWPAALTVQAGSENFVVRLHSPLSGARLLRSSLAPSTSCLALR